MLSIPLLQILCSAKFRCHLQCWYCCDDQAHTGADHRVTAAAADLISGLIARKAENSFSVRNVYNVRNVYSAPAPNITADLHTSQGHSAGAQSFIANPWHQESQHNFCWIEIVFEKDWLVVMIWLPAMSHPMQSIPSITAYPAPCSGWMVSWSDSLHTRHQGTSDWDLEPVQHIQLQSGVGAGEPLIDGGSH